MCWWLWYAPDFRDDALHALGVAECICEDGLGVVQAVDARSKQEMGSSIERESEHHVECIDFLSLVDLGDEDLGMLLEDVDVAQAIFDELRSNELS